VTDVRPIRVLACEDSQLDLTLIERELTRAGLAFTLRWVQTVADAERALRDEAPDIALSDYNLPDGRGTDVLRTVQTLRPFTPFILITGVLGEELAGAAVRAGATDFLLKDNLARLPAAVTRALREATERRRAAAADRALRRLGDRLQELHEIAVATNLSVGHGIQESLRLGASWFGAHAAVVSRVQGGALDVVYRHGDVTDGHGRPIAGTCTETLFAGHEPLALPRPERPLPPTHAVFGAAKLATWIGAPLLVQSRPFGTLEFACGIRDAHDQADLASIQLLARWIAAQLEREMLERQLTQSQKLQAVGTLAGGVAHDFNNLIAAVRSTAEWLRLELGAHGPAAAAAGEIVEVADRAHALTRQLLTFSRQDVAEARDVDAGALVQGVSRMLRRLLPPNVTLEVRLPAAPVGVFADPGKLEQVVMNLCVNARDAMPDGGTITAEVDRVELAAADAERLTLAGPGSYTRMVITDTGTGMDADTLARIFEPFFTTKAADRGTGLGLSVVWGIVGQHGGAVQVASTPGRGTTFTIYLPHATPPAGAPASGNGRRSVDQPRAGGTILLVDDEASLLRATARILRHLGYTVLPFADAAGAVAALKEHRGEVDLALLDVMLPGISGPALLQLLREVRPELPVLFTSGYARDARELQMVRQLGADALRKPFSVDELAAAVRRVLPSREGAATSERNRPAP
jgi:signal transduction histidine kinase/DNA-binding response OmpR family regulator